MITTVIAYVSDPDELLATYNFESSTVGVWNHKSKYRLITITKWHFDSEHNLRKDYCVVAEFASKDEAMIFKLTYG